MPLISGTIPSLINGISQQPATLRMPNQGESQVNGFSHVSRGLQKRPCTEHVAEIIGITSSTSDDVFIHTIRRSEDEAYALVIKGGTNASGNGNAEMRLYDLTGFATGTAGEEVYIQPDTILSSGSGTGYGSGEVTGNGTLNVSYLSNFTASSGTNPFAPNKLGATTIADYTFLLNKTTKVKKNTTTTQSSRNYESLIHFRVGDYGADYKITITEFNVDSDGEINKDSSIHTHSATYVTPDNETQSRTHGDTKSLNNATAVIVSNIAESFFDGDLAHLTVGSLSDSVDPAPKTVIKTGNCISKGTLTGAINASTLNAATTGRNPWTVRFDAGESLMYIGNDSKPFVVECTDGKGDSYMVAINGSDEVSSFGKLPGSKHPNNGSTADIGFVAKISGDKNSGQDDYYVKWNGSVWKECARPKYPELANKHVRKDLDATTLPLRLFKAFDASGDIYFVLKTVPWESREVGDEAINPFPSFANYDEDDFEDGLYEINDIFFHRNRLGFVSDENVILSSAANYYQFFATTVLSVLDTAVIDVAVSNNQVAILKSAIPFQENLLLFSDLQQFKLTSDAFLTPTSVTVDVATNFETSTIAKPVPAGKTIFFPFLRGAYSGIREYFIEIASETNDANEITSHIPELMQGTVAKLAVSSNEEVLCVLGNTDRKKLYIYKYYYADKEKLQSSWSTWQFDADIVDMSFIGSIAFLLFRRGAKIYLEKMNLSVDNATSIMDDRVEVRLDRRIRLQIATLTDTTPSVTAWQANQTHTNISQTSTSGSGTGMKFGITTDASGNPTVSIENNGSGYLATNTIVITDPGSTSNTATVTIDSPGTHESLADYYSDVTHDSVCLSGETVSKLGTKGGSRIKIDASNNIRNKPRVGQTFTSAHDDTITYTVLSSSDIDTTTTPHSVEIDITPSIDNEAQIPDNTVLTFKEREAVYVVETGEVRSSDKVLGTLSKGTEFSKSKGNLTPDIFVGIPYDFEYEFSEQFLKSNESSVNSGRLQMRNFEIAYDRTGFFEVEISPKPHDNRLRKIYTRPFTGKKVGAMFLGQTELQTGVFRVPVYCNSKDVKIKVKSDSWLPLAIQSADWEAFQVLRNQRI